MYFQNMCLEEKCHIGPVWSNNSASIGGTEECSPGFSRGQLVCNSSGQHYPQRVAYTDENGRCFEPCLPKWKLKETAPTGRDQSIWSLCCFTWQPTKAIISPGRMTVQEHGEVGLQFSSSRLLWTCLVSVKAWALQKML